MLHSKDLHFKFAHHEGIGQVAFHPIQNEIYVCGSDGDVRVYNINLEPKNEFATFDNATYTLCFSKQGDQLVCAGEDQKVGLFLSPDWNSKKILTRFDCGIYHLAFSPSGKLLAAAADTPSIKLINVADPSQCHFLQGDQSGFKSVCFDPKVEFIAAADCSRFLRIWRLDSRESVYKKEHFPPVTDVNSAGQMLRLDWHPSGKYLALPGQQKIQCLSRGTWDVQFVLGDAQSGDGHSGPVSVLAFSPNGFYLASAGEDLKILVWNLRSKTVINKVTLEHPVTSISWSPQDNILVYMTAFGHIYKLPSVIANSMPDPFTIIDEDGGGGNNLVLLGEEEDAEMSSTTNANDLADFRDIENSDSDKGSVSDEGFGKKKRRLKTLKEKNEDQYYTEEELYGNRQRREKKEREEKLMNFTDEFSSGPSHFKLPDFDLQPAFQVSSTPEFPKRRSGHFLAWNLETSITTNPSADDEGNVIYHQVEILFSDTTANKRISIRDHYNFVMAALSQRGAVFASQIHITEARPGQKGNYRKSVIFYRPFSSWAQNSEWTIHLDEKEDALCVALNDQTVAVATSLGYIRFFSYSGRQKKIWSMNPSQPIVTMAGYGNLLAIASHAGLPVQGNQNLQLMLVDTREGKIIHKNDLPLSPKATLTWLYFTEKKSLLTMDSAGIVRIMFPKGHKWGPMWSPILDTNRCKKKQRSEHFWPVGLIESSLMCARCVGRKYPLTKPRPVLDALPFQIPLLDLGQNPDILLEEQLMRKRLIEGDARGYGTDRSTQLNMDKSIIKLIDSAIKADGIVRALDLSTSLQCYKSFTIALTLVNHHRKPALAERINLIMQNRFPNGPPSRAMSRRPIRTPTPTPTRRALIPTPTPTPTQTQTPTLTRPPISMPSLSPIPIRRANRMFQNNGTMSQQKSKGESYTNGKRRKLIGKNRLQKQQSVPVAKDTPTKLPTQSNPFSLGR